MSITTNKLQTQYYKTSLHIKIHLRSKSSVHMAALKFAFSFLRIVTLDVKSVEHFYASIGSTFFKNKIGWHLVYEDEAYSLY